MPAGPGQRRISVHVLGVDYSSRVQEKLDGFLVAIRRRAVEMSFGPGSAVTHERARFGGWLRRPIRIGPVGK